MILIVAIALGIVAAFALYGYVQGVEDDLAAETELVTVLILSSDVPQGTPGEDVINAYLREEQIPANFKPGNAILSKDEITGKVAVSALANRQILVPGMFVDPSVARVSFADLLPPEMVTYSVSMDELSAAGGLLAPGDQINILLRVQLEEEEVPEGEEPVDPTPTAPDEDAPYGEITIDSPMRYLYQGAQILTIGRSTTPQVGDAATTTATGSAGGIFTFAVPPEVAQIMYSMPDNSLVFSLISRDYTLRELPPFDEDEFNILPGEDDSRLHPCGPLGQIACDPDELEAFLAEQAGAEDTETAGGLPLGSGTEAEDIFNDVTSEQEG